ncbi:LysE family translocator [Phaeovulum sp.]|uniref:LysE family translocator n=1 Tax=Phaeovulum sp. TaxID=2934796 RepID=UPI0035662263
MDFDLWLVFAAASLALALTPGPNSLLVLDHGARGGFGRAAFTAMGSVAAMLAMVAASMAGLGALMLASETAFTALKVVGAAYLVWLGLRLWRAPGLAARAPRATDTRVSLRRRTAAMQGALVMLSNPKTILFFTTFLPQFMAPERPLLPQFLVLGATLGVAELAVEFGLGAAAGRLAPLLIRHARAFNRLTGGAFIAIGAMVLLGTKGATR